MNTAQRCGVMAVLALVAGRAMGQASFQVLPALDTSHGAYPTGMSANGSIIVGYDSGTASVPVRWDSGVISPVPLPGSVAPVYTTGISAAGDVIVGAGQFGSFRWDAVSGSVRLGNGGGASYPIPIAKCVGGTDLFGRALMQSSSYAMMYRGGAILAIGVAASFASVNGASADGKVAVGETIGDFACRWMAPDTAGAYASGPGEHSRATAVSADGHVSVGYVWNAVDGSDARAFKWLAGASAFQELPRPAGATMARALAVNGDGRVFVGMHKVGGQSRSAIWTSAGAFDFQTMLVPYNVVPQGWVLKELDAISSDGMTIAGWGGVGTTAEAFVVRLPTMCYANCDGSTASPFLNINDFQCFLGKYAAGDAFANCDGSTAVPVLNANDFQCFLGKFAAGCT